MKVMFLLLPVLFLLNTTTATSQVVEKEYHQRMKWWDDCLLGMFLHWGIYSICGGEYNGEDHGKKMGQASAEWVYFKANH